MRQTALDADGQRIEVVIGEPGDVDRFIEEHGLFGGNASNYVTIRHEASRYRDREGNTYWVVGHRDVNKRMATALHEAVVMDACEGGSSASWWPAAPDAGMP